MTYTNDFLRAVKHLVENYVLSELHQAMIAQWILESERGNSKLAREQNNFAGMKWRTELEGIGEQRWIKVPSEPAPVPFAWFREPELFVRGFFKFLDRSPYEGWRETKSPSEYIEHIGSIWATDPRYIEKVKSLFGEARQLIERFKKGESDVSEKDPKWFRLYSFNNLNVIGFHGPDAVIRHVCDDTERIAKLFEAYGNHNIFAARPEHYATWDADDYANMPISDFESEPETPEVPPGTSEPEKPGVIRKPTPNQSSRNGVPIRRIVLHYTTSRNPQGTISWFANPAARVSAHYMVGRGGELWQFVSDDRKAWHAAGHNSDTIGIENVARQGDKLTHDQEQKLIELLKWLMAEYKIPKSQITGHKWLPNSTSCPGSLWKTEADLRQWVEANL